MKKPKTNKQYAKSILDMLFQKEPSEAELLLYWIFSGSPDTAMSEYYRDNYDNSKKLLIALSNMNQAYLIKSYKIATIISDTTHCDELPIIDGNCNPESPH